MRGLVEGTSRRESGDGCCPQNAKQTEPGSRWLILRRGLGHSCLQIKTKPGQRIGHGILIIGQASCCRSAPLAPKPIDSYAIQHPPGTRLSGSSCHPIAQHRSCLGWNETAQKGGSDKLVYVFPDPSHRLSLNFPPGSPKCQTLYSCGFLCIMSPC